MSYNFCDKWLCYYFPVHFKFDLQIQSVIFVTVFAIGLGLIEGGKLTPSIETFFDN